MCRYGNYGPYKSHFACFRCRKAFKREIVALWPKDRQPADGIDPAPCPQCKESMADMGLDFEAPPADDSEHWEVVEFLFRKGFRYHSCGCDGPGYRPASWRDVPDFLAQHKCVSAGEALAERFAARRNG